MNKYKKFHNKYVTIAERNKEFLKSEVSKIRLSKEEGMKIFCRNCNTELLNFTEGLNHKFNCQGGLK